MEPSEITQASIIATALLFPDRVDEISDNARLEWFTGPFRKAFQYVCDNGGGDAVALSSAVGVPLSDVSEWMDQEFTVAYLPQHLANLEREASVRKVQFLGNQLLKAADPEEAMNLVERFTSSFGGNDNTEPIPIKKGLSLLNKEIERRHQLNGEILGISYGLADLDAVTEGMHRGDLVVVAGPSSMGKTAFAIGCGESAACAGHKVLIFSCEMTVEQLLMRSLSAHSGVPLGKIRSARNLCQSDWGRMGKSFEEMNNWNLEIDDPAGISLAELTRKVRKAKKKGLDLVIIDYLQIMTYDKSKETQELDTITTALKNLAKELKICVVLLSQLNRASEKEKRKPTMSDLRGSGMIENNADVILFPYREAANCPKCLAKEEGHDVQIHQSKAEVIVGKQRQGERNISVKLVWIGSRTRFVGATANTY